MKKVLKSSKKSHFPWWMRVWSQIWSTILNGCIQLSGAFYLLENCGHLDKDLSTSSNPYLKKSLSTLSNEDTLFDKGVSASVKSLEYNFRKKNRQPEALVMGVVRGAVMTDVSSKKSVLKCIGKWIHQLFFAPLKKPLTLTRAEQTSGKFFEWYFRKEIGISF